MQKSPAKILKNLKSVHLSDFTASLSPTCWVLTLWPDEDKSTKNSSSKKCGIRADCITIHNSQWCKNEWDDDGIYAIYVKWMRQFLISVKWMGWWWRSPQGRVWAGCLWRGDAKGEIKIDWRWPRFWFCHEIWI